MEICESEKIAAIKLIRKFEKNRSRNENENLSTAAGFRLHVNPPIKISVTSAI